MICVKKKEIIIQKRDVASENSGVFKPAIIQEGNKVHMLYHAARKGNYSTKGYCELDGSLKVIKRNNKTCIIPFKVSAVKGVEESRIVKIDNLYYIAYTAYYGINALVALLTSTNLVHFEEQGIITPKIIFNEFKLLVESINLVNPKFFSHVRHLEADKNIFLWDKDIMFFPRRINGNLTFLHRMHAGIQIVSLNNLVDLTKQFWNNYFLKFNKHVVFDPIEGFFENDFVGASCPPIETDKGWILIYHVVQDNTEGYVYSACPPLLDLENPTKIIARLPYPFFVPEFDYELTSVVNRVACPNGVALFDDALYVYYGEADKFIACASLSLKELTEKLMLNP